MKPNLDYNHNFPIDLVPNGIAITLLQSKFGLS